MKRFGAAGARIASPWWILSFAAIAAAAAACRAVPASHAPQRPGGYLRADIDTSPISLDPRFATDAASSRICELLYDALVRVDEHGSLVPNLAEAVDRPSPAELIFH